MVEVFKTNVIDRHHAKDVLDVIRYHFKDYKVNFDLDDCDRILRIESSHDIEIYALLNLLRELGIKAEILLDEPFLLIIT